MLNSSQFARSAVIAVTVISLGAGPAMARPADQPARSSKAAVITVAHQTAQWTQPRLDGTGVRPADRPVASAAPAVPLTRPAAASEGVDWLPLALLGLAALAALTLVGLVRRVRHHGHSFHVGQV